MLKKIICLLGVVISISANATLLAPLHQFQPGETASAAMFNDIFGQLHQATANSQQAIGFNDNTIIAKDSLADAVTAAQKNANSNNPVTILLNASTTYQVTSTLVIPSYVTIKTIGATTNGSEGANIKLANDAQITLSQGCKLFGVNINGATTKPLVIIAGAGTLIENSSITQTRNADLIKLSANGANLATITHSLLQISADTNQKSAIFNGDVQGKITCNQCSIQNPAGSLSNTKNIKFNLIMSEVNTDTTGTTLNAVFSYRYNGDGMLVEIAQ